MEKGDFSIDDIVERVGFGPFQWRLLFQCGIPLVADAMQVLLMAFISTPAMEEFGCSHLAISLVSSCVFLGMFFGAMGFGILSDAIGRRMAFTMSMAFTGVAGVISAVSPNVYVLMLTRCLVGMGCGGLMVGITLYAEFLPTHSRSVQLTLIQVFWTLGVVGQCLVAWAMSGLSWRWLITVSACPALASCAMFFVLPESPRYLALHGRHEEATRLFQKIAEANGTVDKLPSGFSITSVAGSKITLRQLWEAPHMRLLTCTLGFAWFAAAMIYYGVVLLTSQMEYSGVNKYVGMVAVSISEIPAYGITYVCAVRFGRKNGMVISAVATAFFLASMSVKSVLPLWCIVPIVFGARCGVSVLFALIAQYTPEAFPTPVRSTGVGVCSAMGRVSGIVTPLIAIQLHAMNELYSIGIYSGVAILFAVACTHLPFDTVGRPLADSFEPQKHLKV